MIKIPNVNDASVLEAAQLYAEAGLYVGPLAAGTKHPGSVLGKGWQHQTSRDPDQIAEWFADTDYGVFIHCGRSGLIVIDVDYPDRLPAVLADNLDGTPHQSTRPDQPGRGHYLFAQPAGRRYGNGAGRLGSAWGDIRGANGVIVAAPSQHGGGGEYRWLTTGVVPELPAAIGEQLTEPARSRTSGSAEAADAVSDAAVQAFLDEHTEASRPGALAGRVKGLQEYLAAGNGRHTGTLPFLIGAIEEAAAGLYPAQAVVDAMGPLFFASVVDDGSRSAPTAWLEFHGLLAFAIGQAEIADLDAVRARVEDAMGVDGEAAFEAIAANVKSDKTTPPCSVSADDLFADMISAAQLGLLEFPPLVEFVPGLICEGFGIVAGPPKIGKSWWTLGLALAIASGGKAFGRIETEPRPVLLLALEDSRRRILSRINMIWTGPLPAALDIITRPVPGRIVDTIKAWLDRHPDGLVILDTIGRCRPPRTRGEDPYLADYKFGVTLKELVDEHPGSALLGVHHTRKMASDDFIDDLSGTLGLAGSTDYAIVLRRPRGSIEAQLQVTGRDAPEGEYAFTVQSGLWTLSGLTLPEAAAEIEQRQLVANLGERSREVLEFVNEHPAGLTPADVAEKLGLDNHAAGTYLGRLADSGRIKRLARGLYVRLDVETVESVEKGADGKAFHAFNGFNTETEQADSGSNGTVEKPADLDPNGWPLCAGGCGLGVNPAISDSDRHGFCS